MVFTILDIGIIGGGFFGIAGIFFPKFLFLVSNPVTEKKYNKEDAWKYRIWGVIIVIIGIFFIFMKIIIEIEIGDKMTKKKRVYTHRKGKVLPVQHGSILDELDP